MKVIISGLWNDVPTETSVTADSVEECFDICRDQIEDWTNINIKAYDDDGELLFEDSEFDINDVRFDISDDERNELRRRMDDLNDTTRYYIVSNILDEMFYDIETDCWCSERSSSTGFKRERHAQIIYDSMDKDYTEIKRYDK